MKWKLLLSLNKLNEGKNTRMNITNDLRTRVLLANECETRMNEFERYVISKASKKLRLSLFSSETLLSWSLPNRNHNFPTLKPTPQILVTIVFLVRRLSPSIFYPRNSQALSSAIVSFDAARLCLVKFYGSKM